MKTPTWKAAIATGALAGLGLGGFAVAKAEEPDYGQQRALELSDDVRNLDTSLSSPTKLFSGSLNRGLVPLDRSLDSPDRGGDGSSSRRATTTTVAPPPPAPPTTAAPPPPPPPPAPAPVVAPPPAPAPAPPPAPAPAPVWDDSWDSSWSADSWDSSYDT